VSAFGNAIEEEGTWEILDLIERKIVSDIIDPVLSRDPHEVLAAVRRAVDAGVDATRLAAELLGELRNLLVARLVEDPTTLIDAAPAEIAELQKRAQPHDAETLQRLFRVLLSRNQELGFAPRPEQALEMAVVRLATLPEAESLRALIQRLDAIEGHGPGSGGGAPSGSESRAGGASRGEGRGGSRASSPNERPASAREGQIRREARDHPKVQEVIATLDAELQTVRVPRPGGGGEPA
jgi:DNA polymerase-3 subunit gamma/tau